MTVNRDKYSFHRYSLHLWPGIVPESLISLFKPHFVEALFICVLKFLFLCYLNHTFEVLVLFNFRSSFLSQKRKLYRTDKLLYFLFQPPFAVPVVEISMSSLSV